MKSVAKSVGRIESVKAPTAGMTPVKTINPSTGVRFSEQIEMASHLYKLVEAMVIKYIGKGTDRDQSPDVNPENFLEMGHAHTFRTLDSDGGKHTRSVPIAGHYHMVELKVNENNPDEAPEIMAMSGPMQLVTKRVKGRMIQVDEQLNDYDFHTHDVTYVKSEKIQARAASKEAREYIAKESNKIPSPPAGIASSGGR